MNYTKIKGQQLTNVDVFSPRRLNFIMTSVVTSVLILTICTNDFRSISTILVQGDPARGTRHLSFLRVYDEHELFNPHSLL